jgi:transcriptional regulator PpsR
MNVVNISGPDITLRLDCEGVIRDASLSNALSGEDVSAWVGQSWFKTVTDEAGTKVRRMVEDALRRNVSGFRQVTQRFPSGLELLIEYTTVRLGDGAGLIAVGKSLHAVTELQSRLVAAQEEMEREYWKLRELESRYRLLFDNSSEAVVLLRAANLRIVEVNPAAAKALDLTPGRSEVAGREFLELVAPQERDSLQALLDTVREHGKAPGVLTHLGRVSQAWLLRASLITADTGLLFLLQLTPAGLGARPAGEPAQALDVAIRGAADPFCVIDVDGVVSYANPAFARQAGTPSVAEVIGTSLGRWFTDDFAVVNAVLSAARDTHAAAIPDVTMVNISGESARIALVVLRPDDPNARSMGILLVPADLPVRPSTDIAD